MALLKLTNGTLREAQPCRQKKPMSSEKTQSPCEDFARDCVRLAQHPSATPEMRKQLLAQAREWMQMAIEEQEGKHHRQSERETHKSQGDL
jgi:hypothetical protein